MAPFSRGGRNFHDGDCADAYDRMIEEQAAVQTTRLYERMGMDADEFVRLHGAHVDREA